MTSLAPSNSFASLLLNWFDQFGRKDLPWQQSKTPYKVWLSEIMLQQTQVATVIPYFERFVQTFPTLPLLADATEDKVLHLWAGLGYYSRARNLHRTAKIVIKDFAGELPADLLALQSLPGIGKSTAGAILASAFQQCAPILDGNVKRVLTRFHGITEWPGKKIIENRLWQIAKAYTPHERVADYTQAIMDLGATLCTRSKPKCTECPFTHDCQAFQQQLTTQIPQKKPKKISPVRKTTWLVLQHQDSILLQKRPSTGIWGGLWSLPQIDEENANEEKIRRTCISLGFKQIKQMQSLNTFRHTFSHFHLDIQPVLIQLEAKSLKVMESDQEIWFKLHQPQALGLPAPVQSLLRSLL